jgi:MFS family permease
VFIIAGGGASLVSGVIWGKLADKSSRKLMIGCAVLAFLLCSAASLFALFRPEGITPILVSLFFILCVTHEGVRLGRKIYIVDMADGNRRTDYVAVSNTLIGVLLLIVGAGGALLSQVSLSTTLAFYGASSLLAFIVGLRLPEA